MSLESTFANYEIRKVALLGGGILKLDRVQHNVLAMRVIPNVTEDMRKELNIPTNHYCIGLVTSDCDDVVYIGMDESTKQVNVKVIYGETLYVGAANATSKLAGEVIGIISGPSPSEVKSAMKVIKDVVEKGPCFYTINGDDTLYYMSHCISRTGTFLSELAGIDEGEAICYLIAPPLEFTYALDAALKAADVRVGLYIQPPSPTNCGGAFLTGSQSACKAACEAFALAIQEVATDPIRI